MMMLALRNLLQDRLRLALSIAGMSLAIMLILFLLGLRRGLMLAAVAYLDHAPGVVVMLPEGSRNTATGSGRFLPAETVQAATSIPGVERVTPILLISAMPVFHGRKEAIRLAGYEVARGGGPWRLTRGQPPAADNEVVLDEALARRHGFRTGDAVALGGREVIVSGLSRGTSSWTGAYVFARKPLVESLLLAPGAANLALVTPAPGVPAGEMAVRLQALPGTNVMLKREVMANDQRVLAGITGQVILLMVAAASITGGLVVGLMISTATLERQREYSILKAIGARSRTLYRVVVWQAMIAAGLGVVVGAGLAFAVGWVVMTLWPQFPVVIEPAALVMAAGTGMVMAIAGAVLPARTAERLAPAEVLRR